MEPPVASSGPMLRRAATFSHRTERALKDVNGRVGLVNKSQEHLSTSKTTADAQKVTRPSKQYSAVASRYAAPLLSKKQVSTPSDGAHGGHGNVTKLPFSTGRSAPHHQRRPSSDNLSSFQPPMVFAASSRDAKSNTLAKKADANGTAFGSKRPRVGVRASMIEKKSPAQTRAPRFLSLDKGGCSCSKNSLVRVSLTGSTSLLYSAAHWLTLIKLAEAEKKHEVVVDLFRLAITLKAEPSDDVIVQLKRYRELCSSDKVVNELVQRCEGTEQEVCSTNSEVIDKAVCEPEDSKNTASVHPNDLSGDASVSRIMIVPPVVPESEALATKDEPPAMKDEPPVKKAPHFMGRMLSRSSTFSVVDEKSKSQHAKVEYGKKLAKTLEFLATQAVAHSPSPTAVMTDPSPSVAENGDQISEEQPGLPSPSLVSDDQATPGFKVASKILDLASKIGNKLAAVPASENFSSPVPEARSPLGSNMGYGSAEKPVDSLSEWLDGESSEMGTPDVQSALSVVDTVDLSPNCRGSVMQMDVDSLMKQVVSHILPDAIAKSPADPNAAVSSGRSSTNEFHVRRKSWQDAGGQSVTEIVEKISRSHRHSLSAEAVFLSAPGSVEKKVKLFTGLADLKVATPGPAEPSAPDSASKECHETEGVGEHMEAVKGNTDISQTVKDELLDKDSPVTSPIHSLPVVDAPVENESAVKTALETESAAEVSGITDSPVVQSEGSKVSLATPLRVSTNGGPMKGDALPPPIPATPSAATPLEPASVRILKARHRRSSSMGNMTPRVPFDTTGECSPFGESASSPSGQSSSAKSKRVSRGYKEVTPRIDLPKPSWKAIVEREMKGSKLKDLLAAELPKESSPLAEYVQSQIENQNRDPESGSTGAKENDVNSTCSPARPVRKMTRSSSMKKPASKEEQQEGAAELSTAQKQKNQNEGEQELDTSSNGCSTPGSAVRRSARIQRKMQSRRDMVF